MKESDRDRKEWIGYFVPPLSAKPSLSLNMFTPNLYKLTFQSDETGGQMCVESMDDYGSVV